MIKFIVEGKIDSLNFISVKVKNNRDKSLILFELNNKGFTQVPGDLYNVPEADLNVDKKLRIIGVDIL